MASRSRSGRSRARARSGGLRLPVTRSALPLPLFIGAAVVLGGASAAGIIPNVLLQLAAVVLTWLVAMRPNRRPFTTAERQLIALGAAVCGIGLLQLVALPPSLWGALPGRAPILAQFHLLGAPPPWLPVSLAPAATVASLLGLTIATAAFALVYRALDDDLGAFAWMVVAAAALSVIVGFLQLVTGTASPLYLYSITNHGQPVGFFANSNHLATLELVAMPFLAALAARRRGSDGEVEGRAGAIVILATFGVILLLGIATNGSLAGLGLLLPTLIGCFLLFRGGRSRRVALIGFAVAVVIVGGFIALALNSPLISGYANTSFDAAPTSRLSFLQHSLSAIRTYFPVGTGLGSFVSVFPQFEKASLVNATFVNHAHNDYVELVLELGVPGVVLIAAFLGWWAWRVVAIWRDRESAAMMRAATVATAVVLAHSLVDYPARTAAIMAIFVAACAIMARPVRVRPVPLPVKPSEDAPAARHLSA